ncbi:MAG: hypothetical protein AMS17_09225 [Spirochaetes bacterium DG_61]|nr:MAG: hypothetical protein AMS17_09225 [Spirochaetes bacterium DG_61]
MEDLEDVLKNELKKICDQINVKIVELTAKRGKNGLNIQVIIYKDGGVTIQDCEKVSNLFTGRLNVLGSIEEDNYSLQVSSPGLYRELKDAQEYSIFLLRQVKVFLKEPVKGLGNNLIIEGKLEGFANDTFSIDVKGKKIRLPLSRVRKTKLNG